MIYSNRMCEINKVYTRKRQKNIDGEKLIQNKTRMNSEVLVVFENTSCRVWTICYEKDINTTKCLRSLSTDTTGELNVLGHDSNTLGVDSTEVSVFKKAHKVGLSSLLKRKDC